MTLALVPEVFDPVYVDASDGKVLGLIDAHVVEVGLVQLDLSAQEGRFEGKAGLAAGLGHGENLSDSAFLCHPLSLRWLTNNNITLGAFLSLISTKTNKS